MRYERQVPTVADSFFKQNRFYMLDGAMGTQLQAKGLELGHSPEVLNITNPAPVMEIYKSYIQSGSDIISACTFGANEYKLEGTGYSVEEVIGAAVTNALKACEGTDTLVALDIGPIGELLEPAGTLAFERAYEIFKRQVVQGVRSGAQMVIIETMTDLYEVKAAVLAAKENSTLPILCMMTYEQSGRTFTGCTVESMAMTLEGLGVDAIGLNCSLGPKEIFPIVECLVAITQLPVAVKPNAGLPNLQTGAYDVTPEIFGEYISRFADIGVNIFGGCCGTTPAHIQKIREVLGGKTPVVRKVLPRAGVCTPTKAVWIDGVKVIGERINPTGKRLFKEALQNHNIDYILGQGISQVESGADILDVNVGLPGIDEAAMMKEVVKQLQSVLDTPLQIDSNIPAVIEGALRIYNGKAIVNSVNGEEKVLNVVLPVVKKYGAAVVGLALDENGIPPKAEERVKIAKKILDAALSYGIPKEDVIIDCLVLTASTQQAEVVETLKAVKLVKEQLGLKTVLGVSNISFGLPQREIINQSFLTMAMANGLDLPILNPGRVEMMDAIAAFNVLYNRDKGAGAYIDYCARRQAPVVQANPVPNAGAPGAVTPANKEQDIPYAILKGLKNEVGAQTAQKLQTMESMQIINDILIPALDVVGEQFEKGKLFLPQLIQAAQAAQAGFDVIKQALLKSAQQSVLKGKIVLATVKGDIHDIGKNIVKVILENYGYQIFDLGRDVPVERVVQCAKEQDVKLVGLSALMTTTLGAMEETIRALKEQKPDCKVVVGGAVLTKSYAMQIGADFYAKDAKETVDAAKQVLG